MTIFFDNRPLLDGFRNGDKDTLSAVYYHYVDIVESLVRNGFLEKHTGSRMAGIYDAETQRELVQEIFARAFSPTAILGYDGIRPYKSYLTTIARNVVIDYYRKQPRDPLALVGTDAYANADAQSSVDGISVAMEKQSSLDYSQSADKEESVHWQRSLSASERFIDSLGPLEKQFVQLRYKQGLAQREIVQHMGISRWKVRSLEKRLEKGLSKYLKTLNLKGK